MMGILTLLKGVVHNYIFLYLRELREKRITTLLEIPVLASSPHRSPTYTYLRAFACPWGMTLQAVDGLRHGLSGIWSYSDRVH